MPCTRVPSKVLVLVDGRFDRVPLVLRDDADELLHGAHGAAAAGEARLDVAGSLLAHLLLDLLLGCLLHGLHGRGE